LQIQTNRRPCRRIADVIREYRRRRPPDDDACEDNQSNAKIGLRRGWCGAGSYCSVFGCVVFRLICIIGCVVLGCVLSSLYLCLVLYMSNCWIYVMCVDVSAFI